MADHPKQRLEEAQERLDGILAAALDAVVTVNDEQRIGVFNHAAERMFACDESDALNQRIERFLPDWHKLRTHEPRRARLCETIGQRADGQPVPLEVSISLVSTNQRRLWTCVARDIRDRARIQENREDLMREQAARKQAETGRERMLEVARENARLYRELRHADRLKDQFLAMLAHELRNPLAPIRNALHLIHLSDPKQQAQHAECFAVIDRQVNHLVRLVDDLLDVSRIRQGKIQLRTARLDLSTVVASAVESSQPLIEERRHRLTVVLPEEPLIVQGDAVRLVQVLANLLNNAAKYTPEGGTIDLKVSRASRRKSGQVAMAMLRVRDNGIGIPQESQPHLFDLFAQEGRMLDGATQGLGIGLTLVRRLTEMHGGTVKVSSGGPGQGSEFTVRLPLIAEQAPIQVPFLKPESGKGSSPRRRILVVDDNQDSATTLARLLQLLGNEVCTAATGAEALRQADSFSPEIVLLDIGLPGMDGYEVATQLRTQRCFDETLLIALTGYGTAEDRRHSQEAGFNAHLVKPVDLEALKHLLSSPESLRQSLAH